MTGKTPVTVLQEYCAKKGLAQPKYVYDNSDETSKSFICLVESMGVSAEGEGRSKKEAKHDSAAKLIKRLKPMCPELSDIPQAPHEQIPMSDAILVLRDLCLQKDHPLPEFELVRQSGSPEAPEFEMKCQIASIIRYAQFSTKKGAKQLVAQKMINILQAAEVDELEKTVVLNDYVEQKNEDVSKKIKTYRDYKNSDIKEVPGLLLKDRHSYFQRMENDVKTKAFAVLAEPNDSSQDKVFSLMKALGISYKTRPVEMQLTKVYEYIELNCDVDVVFAGEKYTVYDEILEYFRQML